MVEGASWWGLTYSLGQRTWEHFRLGGRGRGKGGHIYGQTTPLERVERLKPSAKKEQKRWTEKWEQIESELGGGCGEMGRNMKAKNSQTRSTEKGEKWA